MAGGGDPTLAAKALKLLDSDKDDFNEILAELVDELLAPPEQA